MLMGHLHIFFNSLSMLKLNGFFKVLALKSVFSFNIYFRVGDFDIVSFTVIFSMVV